MSSVGRQAMLPVSQIRENTEALRTEVEKDNIQYQELVNAIRKHGFTSVITVREVVDPITGDTTFPILDGLHRYTAACEVGLTELPVLIVDKDESEVLAAQVMANATRVETKPAQFAIALKKVLQYKPSLTKEELGASVGKSGAWVEGQLKLTKLTADIQKLVDEGKLVVSNAIALATLPVDKQVDYVSEAMSQSPAQFGPKIAEIVKELRAAARQGRVANLDFKPLPTLRKAPQLKATLDEVATGNIATLKSLLDSNGVTDPIEAAALTLKWVLNLDPHSVAIQKAKWDQEKEDKKASKEAREKEKEAKKIAEAQAAAAKIGAA